MIFLGAGASEPYGIPTLKEFSDDAIAHLTRLGHGKLIDEIKESLNEFNIELDFEALYSILEKLSDPIKSIQLSDPFTAFVVKTKENLPSKYDYSVVLNELREVIYEKCSITAENFPEVERCMNKLLEVTDNNPCEEYMLGRSNRSIEIGKIFVTTNYDMSIEQFFESKRITVNDGYKEEGFPVKNFDPLLLLDPYTNGDRAVIKLHGSIWQFLHDTDMIKTKVNPNSSDLPYKIKVDQEMMIYPTRQKDIFNYQYFPFYQCFRNISWTKLLVIGYSFRDELINKAIIENMIFKESQLIIVNPDCGKALKNLYSNLPENMNWKIPDYRLYKFDGFFGNDDVFEYLKSIERVSWDQR
jgi:hypothetical protein